ncbi:MAG: hypothetical protein JNL12_20125 [Planctomycetes bacterium]|nr:hypothetical protein [Planctomycetota bacterium]
MRQLPMLLPMPGDVQGGLRSAVVATWCRVRIAAAGSFCAAAVVACVWLLVCHSADVDHCGFAGLLVAVGFALGAFAGQVVAVQLASPIGHGGAAWSRQQGAAAEVVVLLATMAFVPLAGLAVVQIVAVLLGTSWVQPFTLWECCSAHRDARQLSVAVLWTWLLTPCTYAVAAGLAGRRFRRWVALAVVLAAVPFASSASWDGVVEPLLADWRVPGWLFAVPAIGLLGGVVTRLLRRGACSAG